MHPVSQYKGTMNLARWQCYYKLQEESEELHVLTVMNRHNPPSQKMKQCAIICSEKNPQLLLKQEVCIFS